MNYKSVNDNFSNGLDCENGVSIVSWKEIQLFQVHIPKKAKKGNTMTNQ